MRVIVDTPVWSSALRKDSKVLRPQETAERARLKRLIERDLAVLVGPVRQELLSGIRDKKVFERIASHLRAYEDEPLTFLDFEEAARAHDECRSHGIAGSQTDFLICGVALRRELEIFTTDKDFQRYARHLPLVLHSA